MTQKKAIIVKSATPPTNTEVLWQDLSSDPPQLKSFINGGWKQLNSESTEVTDLRNELNASINEVNSTLNDKIDTKVSTLDDKIDASIDVLNDKIDDEIAAQTETSQGIQEDLDGTKTRVATLEDTYEDTMNIANLQINELIDGKAQIAQALTDRGYPTAPTDSSVSMAQKIEDMEYGAGWLAQLGYTENLDGGFKAEVRRVKEIQDALRNGALTTLRNRTDIYFINPGQLPDTTSMQYFLSGTTNLRFVGEIVTNATDFGYFHLEGTTAIERIDRIVSPNATAWNRSLSQIKSIGYVDFTSAVTLTAVFYSGNNQIFIEIHNLGKAPACTSAQLNGSSVWGAGSEENRQSLVDSLLTYSFDRATAGYSACTITLHADTLARLTAEEIAAITAKGFTLTS